MYLTPEIYESEDENDYQYVKSIIVDENSQ